jgi:asparagine synthase (glutamine-hydrolysing)
MCGIAGWLARSGDPEALIADVARMTATLEHRGPDDHGLAAGPGWAIGMRRLAIQDTSLAGHQPMRLGDLTLVFNGEVYNFHELRRELEPAGYDFRSGSDTEVVLAALHHWGPAALERFNGMFALALVDERRRRALLARDRFGKKPLFIGRLGGGVAFASELKALIAVAREELSVSRSALAAYFRFQYVPGPLAIFEQVDKLPPASWTEVDLDGGAIAAPQRYWRLPAESDGRPATPEEVLEVVDASVRRRLVADVPVGAFLSGGTDSSLVVASMCAAAAEVRTFSIGFSDPRFDESRYAQGVATALGTDHTHLQLEWREAMELVPDLATAYDEPFADSSAIPTLTVSRLARRDVTVALSGDGGDELFGGYTRYRWAPVLRVASMFPAPLARALAPLHRLPTRGRAFLQVASAGGRRAPYRELVSVWRTPELGRLMPGVAVPGWSCDPAEVTSKHPVEAMMRTDARTYIVDDILQKVDRASMAVSLEARNPLLDPDVVALAFRSTAAARSEPAGKPLLRDALRLRLPAELVDRPKMGFGVPVGEWMRDGLRELVEDLVIAGDGEYYDHGTAAQLAHRHLAGSVDATARVWSLLAFELWRRRWLYADAPELVGASRTSTN